MKHLAILTESDIRAFGGAEKYIIELVKRLKDFNITAYSSVNRNVIRVNDEKIKKLLNENCYKYKNIHYVFYIYKDTYDIIKQMEHLIKKQIIKFGSLVSKEKCLGEVLIKKCGTDLYKSGDCISIIH